MYTKTCTVISIRVKIFERRSVLEVQESVFSCFGNSSIIFLFGDFNSRTSDLEDFVQLDRHLSERNGLEEHYVENSNILYHFDQTNMSLVEKLLTEILTCTVVI